MTVLVPDQFKGEAHFNAQGISTIARSREERLDIRPMRIGILNLMPSAQDYEVHLLAPLGRPILQVEPIWIRLASHAYKSTPHAHLDKLYVTYKEAKRAAPLDGLIITGAPVELLPFEDVTYWSELEEIIGDAHQHSASILGICWGGLALARYIGLEKKIYPKKIFGVFPHKRLTSINHPLVGGFDDIFLSPQSRHAGISDALLEAAAQRGEINLLAWGKESGYTIFETVDHRLVMHLGHPEYIKRRLVDEYLRDRAAERIDVDAPHGIDLERPRNTWRSQRNSFFEGWLKLVYLRSLGIETDDQS
jgi:homoserine O-succinyltransferase